MNRIDISLAKIGVLLSIALLGLRLLASQVFLIVIPLAAGAGSVVYLLTGSTLESPTVAWRSRDRYVSAPTLPRVIAGYLPSVVLLGLAALVVIIHQTGTRTMLVYGVIGAIGVGIFAQILFVDDDHVRPGIILTEILLAAIVIRLSALYVTPGFVGVDIWTHATVLVDGIARQGSIAPLSEFKYLMAPFYHVIGAIGTLLFGSPRNGIYLTMGVIVPLSALFVYGAGTILVPARWALLATAFVAFSDQFIRWGMHIIPTSLGLALFLAVLYAVTRLFYADAERWAVGLLLVASLGIVFTHQVSTAVLLVFLGIATLVGVTASMAGFGSTPSGGIRKALAIGGVFVVTLVTTITSWSLTPYTTGNSFLLREIEVIQHIVSEQAGFLNLAGGTTEASGTLGGPETGTLVATLIPYVELVGFALLLLAAVLGGLFMLRWEGRPDLTVTHLLSAALLFVIVFGLSLFGIRALLPGRWIGFLYISMALLGAVGLYNVSSSGSRRVAVLLFVLIAVGYPTSMVVAEKATLDNPVFDDQHNRFSFTAPEIAATETISQLHPPSQTTAISTDHPYKALFDRYAGYGEQARTLELRQSGPYPTAPVVYRTYQTTGPAIFDRSTVNPIDHIPETVEATICPIDWNVAYANDDVKLCLPSSTAGGDA